MSAIISTARAPCPPGRAGCAGSPLRRQLAGLARRLFRPGGGAAGRRAMGHGARQSRIVRARRTGLVPPARSLSGPRVDCADRTPPYRLSARRPRASGLRQRRCRRSPGAPGEGRVLCRPARAAAGAGAGGIMAAAASPGLGDVRRALCRRCSPACRPTRRCKPRYAGWCRRPSTSCCRGMSTISSATISGRSGRRS